MLLPCCCGAKVSRSGAEPGSGGRPKGNTLPVLPTLTYKENTPSVGHAMGIFTVRLTESEERLLDRRSRDAGMTRTSFVRMLICDRPFETAADVLEDAQACMGDARLRA